MKTILFIKINEKGELDISKKEPKEDEEDSA